MRFSSTSDLPFGGGGESNSPDKRRGGDLPAALSPLYAFSEDTGFETFVTRLEIQDGPFFAYASVRGSGGVDAAMLNSEC
jgi:hypothetical protein